MRAAAAAVRRIATAAHPTPQHAHPSPPGRHGRRGTLKVVAAASGAVALGYAVYQRRQNRPIFPAAASPVINALADAVVLPVLRWCDPETAHRVAILLAAHGVVPCEPELTPSEAALLRTSIAGLPLSSPVMCAAGFDKQAEAIGPLLGAGFAAVEVGSVTPLPQPGNPRPRVFRLLEDEAVINRYGFNSDGAVAVARRIAEYTSEPHPPGLLGINLGKNKEGDAHSDYVRGTEVFAPFADYLVVNVSSPNTPGLRKLQARAQLTELLAAVRRARDGIPWGTDAAGVAPDLGLDPSTAAARGRRIAAQPRGPPIFVKVAPDLTDEELEDIVEAAVQARVDGMIVTNTTVQRPGTLRSVHKIESGGLSGRPLKDASTAVLAKAYTLSRGRLCLIGVGGISSGADAYEKIRAGASAVQLYSALAFRGIGMVPAIKRELAAHLERDGFRSVADAVGTGVRR